MARRAALPLLALVLLAACSAPAQRGHAQLGAERPGEAALRPVGQDVLATQRNTLLDTSGLFEPYYPFEAQRSVAAPAALRLPEIRTRTQHARAGTIVFVDAVPARLEFSSATAPRAADVPPAPVTVTRSVPPSSPTNPRAPEPDASVGTTMPLVLAQATPPATSAPRISRPMAASAARTPVVRAIGGDFLIPTPPEVGAALVQRAGLWLLVLDADIPLDPGPLVQGAFAATSLTRSPQATVLRIPATALGEPRLTRRADGWLLERGETPPALRGIRPEIEAGSPPRLLLRAARPAQTVTVLDPETGGTLLVGTVRDSGEAVPTGRRAATFDILPTRLGAALLPHADTATLLVMPAGFIAGAAPGAALELGPEMVADTGAAGMTRLFDLPAESLPSLIQRERNATLAVAGAPPLGRGAPRLRNAEALIALGLGAEAQAVATLAMREDPRIAEDPFAHALRGAAALLAGRLGEAEGLLHRRLPESDELGLWRGLLQAARGAEGAAPAIAAGLPILLGWPQPLQARLAPLAAEALGAAGDAAALHRMLEGREDDPAFTLARARLLESTGATGPALDAYAAVTQGRDRRARAVAMRRAAELRLATGAIDAKGAAAAMEAVLAAWRGDAMESEARSRLAELRRESGDHRGAFEMLRETEQLFPELAAQLRPRQVEALLAAIVREPPISAVTLFDAHAPLLPPGAPTEQALAALADGLAALDLPVRAQTVLGQALRRAEDEPARGRIGLRMANLALGAGDAAGARTALADTASDHLPGDLRAARALTEARALARLGAVQDADARYREAGPDAAPEHAEMLAAAQDWAGAAAVLRAHLLRTLPPAPAPLPEDARRMLARTAALLSFAGDEAGLAALRVAEGTRMAGGAYAEAFALITAGRMAGIADLSRVRQEVEMARTLPSRLDALRPGTGVAR